MTARTLVIIPAYNEEESLPAVLKELAEQTPDHDVLVVSDGSTDRTADVARDAGAHVAILPFNLGIGGALRTGFAFAVRQGYERAVQLDADGQHDPLAVRLLLHRLDGGADMVVGSRFAEGGAVTYEVSRVRRRAMQFLEWLVRNFGAPAVHRHQFRFPRLLPVDARVLRGDLPDRVHGLGRGARPRVQRGVPGGRGRREHAGPYGWCAVDAPVQALLLLRPARRGARGVDHQPRAARPPYRDTRGHDMTPAAMSTEAHILVIVLAAGVIAFIVHLVRSRRLRAKYSVLWFSIGFVLAVLAIFPDLLVEVSDLFGISYPPATFMLLALSFLLLLVLHFSWELSRLEDRHARSPKSTRCSGRSWKSA